LSWSRRSRFAEVWTPLFLAAAFVDCFFLLAGFLAGFFSLLSGLRPCAQPIFSWLPSLQLPSFSSQLLSCFLLCDSLLGFCHLSLRQKVAKGTAPKSAATHPRQPDSTSQGCRRRTAVLRPACAGRGTACGSSQCKAATALLTRSRYKTSGSRLIRFPSHCIRYRINRDLVKIRLA